MRHARGDVGQRQGARPDVGEDRAREPDRHEQVRDRRAAEVAQHVGEVPRARRGVEGRPGEAERQRRDREPDQGAPDHLAGAGEVVGEVRRAQRERRAVADHQRHGGQEADRVAAREAAGQRGVALVEGQLEAVDREARGRQAGDQRRPRQHPQAEADHREHDDGEGHHAGDVRDAEQTRQGDAGDADVDPEPPDHHREHHDRRGAPAALAAEGAGGQRRERPAGALAQDALESREAREQRPRRSRARRPARRHGGPRRRPRRSSWPPGSCRCRPRGRAVAARSPSRNQGRAARRAKTKRSGWTRPTPMPEGIGVDAGAGARRSLVGRGPTKPADVRPTSLRDSSPSRPMRAQMVDAYAGGVRRDELAALGIQLAVLPAIALGPLPGHPGGRGGWPGSASTSPPAAPRRTPPRRSPPRGRPRTTCR